MIKENVSREEILAVLDGIENRPGMYGNADTVEGIYWTLLCLLAGDDKVREVWTPMAYLATGFPNYSLSSHILIPGRLVKELKKIRDIIINENS